MNREQFFADADGGYASLPKTYNFMKTWNKVLKYEEGVGKLLDAGYTREEYIAMFNSFFVTNAWTFRVDKDMVVFYIKYLVKHGTLPEENLEALSSITTEDLSLDPDDGRIRYYKNIAMLRESIDETVNVSDRIDETVWDVAISILYLAWFGLTEAQILNLPKKDVSEEGIVLDGKLIPMPGFVTDVLVRLRDSDGYYTQNRNGAYLRKFIYSDFLIRSEDSPQLTKDLLRMMLTRFDKIMDHQLSLNYHTVYLSGIFFRAYMLECESSKFDLRNRENRDFAAEVFCLRQSDYKSEKTWARQIFIRRKEYEMFKRLFY